MHQYSDARRDVMIWKVNDLNGVCVIKAQGTNLQLLYVEYAAPHIRPLTWNSALMSMSSAIDPNKDSNEFGVLRKTNRWREESARG